jgi:hypothetical protein
LAVFQLITGICAGPALITLRETQMYTLIRFSMDSSTTDILRKVKLEPKAPKKNPQAKKRADRKT